MRNTSKQLNKMTDDLKCLIEDLELQFKNKIKKLVIPLAKKYGKIEYCEGMGLNWFKVEKLGSFLNCEVYSNSVRIDKQHLCEDNDLTDEEYKAWQSSKDLRDILCWIGDNFDFIRVCIPGFQTSPLNKTVKLQTT